MKPRVERPNRVTAPKYHSGMCNAVTDNVSKVSVAPMMDWTDSREIILSFNNLAMAGRACLLYVSSPRFSLSMLQKRAPCSIASLNAMCVCGRSSNHRFGMFRLVLSR